MKEKLIELAKLIKDEKLRAKTIELLEKPVLSNPNFKKYEAEDIEKVRTPFTVGGVTVIRELVNHTIGVTEAAIKIAEVLKEVYGIEVNMDYLISGCLLHDIMKVYEWKDGVYSGILLEHPELGAAELYRRDFPEEIIHMVFSHLGNNPKTIEAMILHYVDSLMSLVESYDFTGSKK